MTPEPHAPALRVELRAIAPPAGVVVFDNRGPSPVRVWRGGNSWGDRALSFELAVGAERVPVVRKPQVYTRNVPTPVEIPAGGAHERAFDLGDGTWHTVAGDEPPWAAATRLAAVYEARPSREASDNGVWIGRLRSPEVDLAGPR